MGGDRAGRVIAGKRDPLKQGISRGVVPPDITVLSQIRRERFILGGLGPLAFGDPVSPKAKPPTGRHFAQCPAGGLKRPQMPGTEAVLLGAART
jgi:hypothetical protein